MNKGIYENKGLIKGYVQVPDKWLKAFSEIEKEELDKIIKDNESREELRSIEQGSKEDIS